MVEIESTTKIKAGELKRLVNYLLDCMEKDAERAKNLQLRINNLHMENIRLVKENRGEK